MMSSPPYWQSHIWPCYSCCRQIWIPEDATFGEGCPGIVAYLPVWISLLVFIGRYGLRPLWRQRPLWLRDFASEDDEFASSKKGTRFLPNDSVDVENEGVDEEDALLGSVQEAIVDAPTDPTTGEIRNVDDDEGSDSSTIVSVGRRTFSVGLPQVKLVDVFGFFDFHPWHLMTITLFVLSLAGTVIGLVVTFATSHGYLYLTPVVPYLVSCLILAIDRPRTLPGAVFILHASTLAVQLALLLGIPELSRWPLNITWIAETSVTFLSIGIMMAMPMRDPLWGSGGGIDNEKIAAPFETPSNKHRSPEDNLTLWHWTTVNWMTPLINLGVERQLHSEDIWNLPFQFQHARLYRLFHDVRGSVTARIIKVNIPDLIITSFLGIVDSAMSMLPIIMLKNLLASMEDPEPNLRVASIYAVLICLANIARALAGVFSLWFTRRCYERSRGELITMIYEKTLRRQAFTFPGHSSADMDKKSDSKTPGLVMNGPNRTGGGGRGNQGGMAQLADGVGGGNSPASTGKILNLMRNDVYEVAQRFWEFPTLFTKPLNFLLSMILLWRVLGAASLLGILIIVLAQVVNAFMVRILVRWEMARRAVSDVKLQVTSQFIESIRHLRWYDWQDKWLGDILSARQKELRYRVITNIIQRGIGVVNQIAANFFPVAAFYAYTVIEKRPLTIDVAFPALNLFNLLEQSLRELPDLITVLLNANVAMRRIDAFMTEPDKAGSHEDNGDVLKQNTNDPVVDGIIRPPGPQRIAIENGSFSWPTVDDPILKTVNFVADGNGLFVVSGKVGTGKTALLMSILGEMDQQSGTRSVPKETIGYCAQTPWLQSMSVRENILFCQPFDERRYNRVVSACCLLPDFAEFEAGDLSNIGENGIGLSGGQRARVALARAVYSRARILLLDDPIAALDHQTGESIMKRLFSTSGLMQGRLVVFVTHRLDLVASYADQIYEVSDEGGIVTKIDADSVRRATGTTAISSTPDDSEDDESNREAQDFSVITATETGQSTPNKFIEEEHRAHGGVMLSVYWRYVKAGGLFWWALIVFVFVGFRLSKIGYLYFLKIWGEAYDQNSTLGMVMNFVSSLRPSEQVLTSATRGDEDMFAMSSSNGTGWFNSDFGLPPPETNVGPWLVWFTVLAFCLLLFRTLADALLVIVTYTAGRQVFQEVMMRVSTAPFRFFDVTPVGRLMNRVTSDIGTIDGAIAMQIHRCAWFVLNWLTSIIVIATATPTFLVMAIFMTFIFIFIFFRFLPASQSLRRLEMVSLSPLMSNFGTLLEGLTTVRAFRAQPHFQERIIETTDAFQRMDHFYWSLQAWLLYRFNTLTALSTFILTITALATGLSSGLVAFVLTAAANFVNSTQILCRRYGELQMQFVSVERVTELLDLDQEPVGDYNPPAAWPTANDDIVFDNVTIRYAPHLEPSLRGIDMRIPAGSTVAVTGRTGSGKSTLALALLGTILPDKETPDQGNIYIGGISVTDVNKHALRQRISFVAQDPVLFPGSLRENLDPVGDHTDEECELVLQRVLGDSAGDFGLDSPVDGGGKNMSQGQRQLIGLGRAVLRRSPIVILDEATASIDKKTAFYIQEVLREELRHSTVITIAHRIEAVRDADFSVVLDNGRVIHAAPVSTGDAEASAISLDVDESTDTTQVESSADEADHSDNH